MAEGGKYNNSDVADVNPTSISPGISGSATLAEGENVNLKFTKSSVNVVARDQINANKIVYNSTIVEGETPSGIKSVDYWKLIKVINDHTRQETANGIREDFKNEFPHEPDFEVFPQMKKFNVDDYYRGRREKKSSDDEYGLESRRKAFKSQLIEEVGFYRQSDNDGKPITMEKIMEWLSKSEKLPPDNKVGYTAIVASAGSGKTTLVRGIARKALEIPSEKEKDEAVPLKKSNVFRRLVRRVFGTSGNEKRKQSSPKPKEKMIHYVELKNMKEENCIKSSKFLFGGLFETEYEEDEAFKWLLENQSEALIIFDGLDQVKWDFEESTIRNIKTFDKASTSTIMYNILSRRILRHVKIIVASREFKVSELPAEARPEEIITLNGLTLQDAYKLFTFLLCENGQRLWKKIEIMSPRLLQLVSVPVFLILIAVVMGSNPDRPPPSTVTELYSRILLILRSVENIRNRKQILSIIHKLKEMAFEGMKEGRVVFYKVDLDRCGISTEEVQDLMTKVPGNNLLSRHLMEGDFTFFFCHQSMQEFLAASFISEMELEMFIRFDGQHLHERRWSAVRRFVTGIVYMKSTNELRSLSDQTQKRQIIARSIGSRLQKTGKFDGYVRMELYTAIYESGDDNLMKDLSVIDVSFIPLNRDEAHIVGSLAARHQRLDSLNLWGCSIDDELLSIIARCLENRIPVKEVELCNNEFSATALRSLLGHRRIESLSGKLDWEVIKLTVDGRVVELKNEEDVIKISNRWIKGHFDLKDSTLSFKTVSEVALKYVSDLFDATFVKLIEELLVQEDGLRELSEYRIEKVKEVDVRRNNFSGKALRSLLGHRRIESLAGKLDWEVVKLTVGKERVELMKEEDVIKISGNKERSLRFLLITEITVDGHFNMKESTLSFKMVLSLATVEFLRNLFNAEFVKLIEELHIKQAGLRELSKYKVKKISKILLDCTEEDIDWSIIETCWKKYQLDLLDIAVNGLIPVDDYKLILERGRAISAPLHIHAMFYFEKADEFRKTLEDCQRKKIEYIRCIFNFGWGASLDQISSLVNNSNLKKVTLIYEWRQDMLEGDELQKVQKIANDLDTELEVLKLPVFAPFIKDARQRLDLEFYLRESRKRW